MAAATRDEAAGRDVLAVLESMSQAATKTGRAIDGFELRLATAELELALETPGAAAGLKKLIGESSAKGLEGIAKRAEGLSANN